MTERYTMTVHDIELKNVVKDFHTPGKPTFRAVDNIDLQIDDGEFFALLGPSGCGKTTTLRMIAGFEQPTSGEVLIRGEAMQGVPAFHRPVNTVFQDYALFPHMSVISNVMFGLQMAKVSKKEARKRAEEALELVKLPNVMDRKPTQLSGGQQQRVALARALVNRPAVLLLDEPLGALDLKLRKEMQYELKSMQQQVGITFIYVTHDQEEAMTMADRIAVMNGGEVLQVGPPKEIYEHPADHFVADFIGETNFIYGRLLSMESGIGRVRLDDNTVLEAQLPEDTSGIAGEVTIPIRPERIGIAPVGVSIDFPVKVSIVPGKVLDSHYIGTDTRYVVEIAHGIEVVARIQNVDFKGESSIEVGQDVQVFWGFESTYILNR